MSGDVSYLLAKSLVDWFALVRATKYFNPLLLSERLCHCCLLHADGCALGNCDVLNEGTVVV